MTVCKLDLFDIVYTVNGKFIFAYDRKDRDDISSNEKRFEGQRARALISNLPKSRITYLLEGSNNGEHTKELSHFSNLQSELRFRDGLNIQKEDNILSTMTMIMRDIAVISRDGDFFYDHEMKTVSSSIETVRDGIGNGASVVTNLTSKGQVKPYNALWHMLAVLPRISHHIAKEIGMRYKSLKELIQAYDRCDSDRERIHMLADVPNGKRNTGSMASASVFAHLYASDDVLTAEMPKSRKRKAM